MGSASIALRISSKCLTLYSVKRSKAQTLTLVKVGATLFPFYLAQVFIHEEMTKSLYTLCYSSVAQTLTKSKFAPPTVFST